MPINSTDPSIQHVTSWGDRRPDLFIDTMVKSAAVLNRFSIVDGVKSKLNVPIFGLAKTTGEGENGFGGDTCAFDDTFTADITEKEMSVDTFSWGFKNCKDALETTYRGLMLKKGQLNPETLDAEFRGWIFDRFAKLASEKALIKAGSDLPSLMSGTTGSDSVPVGQRVDVSTDHTAGDLQLSSAVLDVLKDAYLSMSGEMASAVYGDADRDFRPAIFLGTGAYQAYQIAMAEAYPNAALATSEAISRGAVPAYYGMEVVHFPSLAVDTGFITPPSNLVMLTDDYNDVQAIGSEYEAKEHAEYLYGRFKLGFDYMQSKNIVLIKP